MKKIRILGIDPGFGRTGWGVIEGRRDQWEMVDYGCIETEVGKPFVERLLELNDELKNVIKRYRPVRAAVEDLFFAKNVKTAMKVGQARGVVLLVLQQYELPISEFTPSQVKQSITGYGQAGKSQMQKVVQMLLGVKKKITPDDAADALAVAITCGVSLRMNNPQLK